MPVRIRYQTAIGVSSDSCEAKDLGSLRNEVVCDEFSEGGTWKTTLAVGATDVQIHMDNIAAVRFLYLRTTAKDPSDTPGEVIVKRNTDTNEELPIVPLDTTREGHMLWSTDSLTALYATNNAGVIMELTVVAIGD